MSNKTNLFFRQKQLDFVMTTKSPECYRHIDLLFLYHASPVLRLAKPAALITVKLNCLNLWLSRKEALCRATGLKMVEISRRDRSSLFLIYEHCAVKKAITSPNAVQILKNYGCSCGESPEGFIEHLKIRFHEEDFPHEIGIFLGYPPEDVTGFIENNGQKSTCCRYWKAYGDAEKAREIWGKIDEAHRLALEVIHKRLPIHVAANILKAV